MLDGDRVGGLAENMRVSSSTSACTSAAFCLARPHLGAGTIDGHQGPTA